MPSCHEYLNHVLYSLCFATLVSTVMVRCVIDSFAATGIAKRAGVGK